MTDNPQPLPSVDTSADGINRAVGMCNAAGLHGTSAKLRALQSERDALKAELAGARNAVLDECHSAIMGVSVLDMYDAGHTIHYDDLQEFFADTVAALSTSKET